MTDITIPTPELNVEQNGVKKAKEGTIMGYAWAVADALMAWRTEQNLEHTIPTSKEVKEAVLSKLPDAKAQMVSLSFSKWIKFHGLETMRGARALAERKGGANIRSMSDDELIERYKRYAMREIKAQEKHERAHNAARKVAEALKTRGVELPAVTPETVADKPAKTAAKADKASKPAKAA